MVKHLLERVKNPKWFRKLVTNSGVNPPHPRIRKNKAREKDTQQQQQDARTHRMMKMGSQSEMNIHCVSSLNILTA